MWDIWNRRRQLSLDFLQLENSIWGAGEGLETEAPGSLAGLAMWIMGGRVQKLA